MTRCLHLNNRPRSEQFDHADGAIVGTYFKKDGVFENRADQSRVEELMGEVKKFRATLS
jgi:predicted TIM-barrel enzyme